MSNLRGQVSEEEVALFIRDSGEHVVRVVMFYSGLQGRVAVVVAEHTHVSLHVCHSYLGLHFFELFSKLQP